jgi:hypothetical protein
VKTSIYLPDDLAEQVRRYEISISEVAQAALRQAVETARLREKAMKDLDAVVERIKGESRKVQRLAHERSRAEGVTWARKFATGEELSAIGDGAGLDETSPTLRAFYSAYLGENVISLDIDEDEPEWQAFIEGAREVWEAISDKLLTL